MTLPAKLIFKQEDFAKKCDISESELAQLPKVILGEGRESWLSRMILSCGSISMEEFATLRSCQCTGVSGSEGTQHAPLRWEARKRIAVCAAMAIAFIHTQVTRRGNTLVCGVVKASNS
ncbi:hypothetical protein GH714_041934 [Hevea brasiliensis]|uniref:Uncharacterized protein n=1 Tax=Hevea brasiliensis TaxID=3981 RepID=A0A6A6MWK9_HEVBR|nr:hypothetical protein GH714_041934 [Hevea brasiliensis]